MTYSIMLFCSLFEHVKHLFIDTMIKTMTQLEAEWLKT